MDYSFAIPSRKRADKVKTLKLIKQLERPIFIFVDDEAEKKEYEEYNIGDKIKIVNCNVTGIQNVRNFIYDYFEEGEKIVTLCDDVKGVYKLVGKCDLKKIEGKELDDFIVKGFEIAEKNKTNLWGVYPIKNHFFMSKTLSPNNFIIGTFSGIIISDIRCDKELPLKEDYDFTIKHILKYKKVVRFNNYCVEAEHYKNKGGCVDYRSKETEQKSIKRLLELYPNYVRLNTKRENEILLNLRKKKK